MTTAADIVVPSKVYDGIKGSKYYLINTIPAFKTMLELLKNKKEIAIDTETSGLGFKDHVCGIVLGAGPLYNFYIPIAHRTDEKQLDIDDIKDDLCALLQNPNIFKIGHNLKFDLLGLKKLGIEVSGPLSDTMLIYDLLDENADHSLKSAANEFISKDADKWEKFLYDWRIEESRKRKAEFNRLIKVLIGKMKNDPVLSAWAEEFVTEDVTARSLFVEIAKESLRDYTCFIHKLDDISYDLVPLDIMVPYACADVHYTLELHKIFWARLMENSGLVDLYGNEIKLMKILTQVEYEGVKIDRKYLEQLIPKLDKDIHDRSEEIFEAIGYRFNLEADAELVTALQKSGVHLTKLTKGSIEAKKRNVSFVPKYSVDKSVLETLATKYEFAGKVLKYREAEKLKNTYAVNILTLADKNDFLHSSFKQNVITGRMAVGGGVNLTNIPAQDKTIRRSFIVPSSDYIFLFIDFSQVELRLTASFSQDPMLMSCYPFVGEGVDVHTLTTAQIILNMPYEEVLAKRKDKTGHDESAKICSCPSCELDFYRSIAKRVNFGIIYQAEPKTIQQQVSTPTRPVELEACKEYLEKYFQTYRGVYNWIRSTIADLHRCGYVCNAFGRNRRFPNLKKVAPWQKRRYERQAVNFLIQGAAADMFKEAITRVSTILKGRKTRIVNMVHDELQFYVHKSELALIPEIKHAMEDFNFLVPIVAEVSYSDYSWAEKRKYEGVL